jgi:hypothetical protein
MTAGAFVLMRWYLPTLAEGLTTLQPLSVVAGAVLVSGAILLGEVAPALMDG